MRKLRFPAIIVGVCLVISAILSFVILHLKGNLILSSFLKTLCFTYITNMLFFNATLSHRFVEGKKQEILSFLSTINKYYHKPNKFLALFLHNFLSQDKVSVLQIHLYHYKLFLTSNPLPNQYHRYKQKLHINLFLQEVF